MPRVLTGLAALRAVEELAGSDVFEAPGATAPTADRSTVGRALGLALDGRRVGIVANASDLLAATDLLQRAATLRAPLVLWAIPDARGGPGSDQTALRHLAELGWFVLLAGTVQQVVDLALVARRLTEQVLVPGLVVLDREIATGPASVLLPTKETVVALCGQPNEAVHPPTPEQELRFGRHRRRIPRTFDRERPALLGAAADSRSGAATAAATTAFVEPHLGPRLEAALEEVAHATGRQQSRVSIERRRGTEYLLLTSGAGTDVARWAAAELRRRRGPKVGVVGLTGLRPFPAGALVEAVRGTAGVIVLERAPIAANGEGSIASELRAVLARARENHRVGVDFHAEVQPLSERETPLVASVAWGLGGQPLAGADLVTLVGELDESWRSPVLLGIDFRDAGTDEPKRQARQDLVAAIWPAVPDLTLEGAAEDRPTAQKGSLSIAVRYAPGDGVAPFLDRAAALLHHLGASNVIGRRDLGAASWGTRRSDLLLVGDHRQPFPGADVIADLLVWASSAPPTTAADLSDLRRGGTLILPLPPKGTTGRDAWAALPTALGRAVVDSELQLHIVPVSSTVAGAELVDQLLGSLVAIGRDQGWLEVTLRKALEAQRALTENAAVDLVPFQSGLERIRLIDPSRFPLPTAVSEAPTTLPPAVHRAGTGRDLAALAPFWDQFGSLERRHQLHRMAPDPWLPAAQVPPASAALRDITAERRTLPAFDPLACTGCGDCWSVCPDGAIVPAVFAPAALLDLGMARAKAAGTAADALRMVASTLATRIGQSLTASGGGRAGETLDEVFEAMMERSRLPDDRRQSVREAFESVRDGVAELPLASTEPFSSRPESDEKGSGSILALAIDPDACKGCNLCVASCDPGALVALPDGPERSALARRHRDLAVALPPPADPLITRTDSDRCVGLLAAALLHPASRRVLVSGDGAAAGSGAKIAVRQVLGWAAAVLAPRQAEALGRLEELRGRLGDAIHEALARAVPDDDLDALGRGLRALSRPDADLRELTARMERAVDSPRVDAPRVRRLVDSAQALADLVWRFETGAGGLGRVPFGIVVGPGAPAEWAATFPGNPFLVPALLDATGDLGPLTRGLLEGAQAEAVEIARLTRHAAGELDRPERWIEREQQLTGLRWADLTPEESALAGPIVVMVDETTLGDPGLSGALRLLGSDLPVKLLLLSDGGLDVDAGATRGSHLPVDPELLGLAFPAATVVQSTIAHPDHLAAALDAVFTQAGPALVRVIAPEPDLHGFARDGALERARLAVDSRLFPLLVSTPASPGSPATLDLSANPAPDQPWSDGLTPADWCIGEHRFAPYFKAIEDAAETTTVASWLAADLGDRTSRVPAVPGPNGTLHRPTPALLGAIEHRHAVWQTLVELASSDRRHVAEATAETEHRLTASLTAAHDRETADLRRHYEARLATIRDEFQRDTAIRIRNRLLALAGERGRGGHP